MHGPGLGRLRAVPAQRADRRGRLPDGHRRRGLRADRQAAQALQGQGRALPHRVLGGPCVLDSGAGRAADPA